MANPLPFIPKLVDPRLELQRRLDSAPIEHAEALLVGFDILQTAHDNGLLDLAHGLVGGRDIIAAKLAEYAKLPGGVSAIRNLLAAGKLLMAFDADTLDNLSKSVVTATGQHREEERPPSLFQLFRRINHEESRRGLSFLTMLLGALGRSLRTTPETAPKLLR
jgi:uncharacterized protein YjgD (DUF1641 family)